MLFPRLQNGGRENVLMNERLPLTISPEVYVPKPVNPELKYHKL